MFTAELYVSWVSKGARAVTALAMHKYYLAVATDGATPSVALLSIYQPSGPLAVYVSKDTRAVGVDLTLLAGGVKEGSDEVLVAFAAGHTASLLYSKLPAP